MILDKYVAETRSPGPPSPEGPAQRHVPRTHAQTPPAPHTHTAGDAREHKGGTYNVGLDVRVGAVVDEAQGHVPMTMAACLV